MIGADPCNGGGGAPLGPLRGGGGRLPRWRRPARPSPWLPRRRRPTRPSPRRRRPAPAVAALMRPSAPRDKAVGDKVGEMRGR